MSKRPRQGDEGQATTQVREALNVDHLCRWMSQQPTLVALSPDIGFYKTLRPLLSIRQFGFGQSNPTYQLIIGDLFLVLRKKPQTIAHATGTSKCPTTHRPPIFLCYSICPPI